MIPGPLAAAFLILATFRLTRLIGWDDFPPVARLRDLAAGRNADRYSSTAQGRDPIVTYRRPVLEQFLHCPYCQGFWTGLVVYIVWLLAGSPGAAGASSWLFYVLAPFALNGIVGIIARMLDP